MLFNLCAILFLFCLCAPLHAKTDAKIIKDLKPTVILISIDGFKNGYMQQLSVPHLSSVMKAGVHAPLLSVFPSITFPNHYSILTGLYPAHHGILLNQFYAENIAAPFTHNGHAPMATNPNWFSGEPIWMTAQKQGQLTASAFWPSTESLVKSMRPNYFQAFHEDSDPNLRVQQILKWLDLPLKKRPTLFMLYFENVDNAGHQFGPDSNAVQQSATKIDNAIGALLTGLITRGVASDIDLIVLSDHGMSRVDSKKIIDLEKFISKKDLIAITDVGAVVAVYPKPNRIMRVYQALKKSSAPMKVYLASEIPEKWHYHFKNRTPPILCLAEEEAFILGEDKKPQKGTHGYDPSLQSMQGIFIARGPHFKKSYEHEALQNIHIYALIAKLLQLKPVTNDGSLQASKDFLNEKN